MTDAILRRMTGEELLLLRILNGDSVKMVIDAELDRRARMGVAARVGVGNCGRARTAPTQSSPRLAA